MSRKKRIAKSGDVYLLISECGKYFKYGASANLKSRLRNINYKNPCDIKFKIQKTYKSKDIFKTECYIKWRMWEEGGVDEYLYFTETFTLHNMESIMEDVCLQDG